MIIDPLLSQIYRKEILGQIEGVKVNIARVSVLPANKLRTLFKGRIAGAQKIGFVDTGFLQGCSHSRPCALTYADNGNVWCFHHGNCQMFVTAMFAGENSCGEPPGRTTADDKNGVQGL